VLLFDATKIMKICALTFFRVLCFAFKYDDATYGEGAYFTALKPPPANSIAKLEMNNYGQDNQVAGNFYALKGNCTAECFTDLGKLNLLIVARF